MARIRTSSTAASSIKMIADGVATLRGVGSLTKTIGNIQAIAPAINALHAADISGVSEKVATLAQSLTAMSGLKGLSSFGTAMRSLKDLPSITEKLTPKVLDSFGEKIQKISDIMTPLSQKMTSVKQGFQSMNKPIRQTTQATQELSSALSNINLAAIISNIRTGYNLIRQVAETVLKLTDDVVDFDGIVERFRRGFGDSAQEAYDWIQRLNKEMGLNVQVFMQYTSIFAQMLEGLGVAQKDASKMAIGYSELAYDIWAAYNDIYESYGDAVAAVQSAIAGQTRPLRKAGFSVLNVTLKQTAANHGLEVSLQNATEAEKSYLRYLALIDQAQAQGIIGTYAMEMNTAEGQLRTLGQMFRSLTQEAGNLLLPLLTVVVPRVQAAVKLISQAIQKLASLFGVKMRELDWGGGSGFTAAVEGAEDAAEGIESAMGGAAGSAKELKKTLLGIDEINQLNDVKKNSGGGGGGGGGGTSGIPAGYDWDVSSLWTEAIFKDINNQVDELVQKFNDLRPTLEWIAAGIGAISLAALLIDANKLKTVFSTIGEVVLNIALNAAFTEVTLRADLSVNPAEAVLGLLGQWVASAGTGVMMAKTIGITNKQGMGFGFSIGAAIQLIVTAIEVAKGNVEIGSGNWWMQMLSSLGMGAAAGFSFGGGVGAAIGAGVALVLEVVSTVIAMNTTTKEDIQRAFAEKMGTIHLTDQEIELEVQKLKWKAGSVVLDGKSVDIYSAAGMVVEARLDAQTAAAGINASLAEVEQSIGKLRLGIDGSEEALKSSVDAWLDNIAKYIESSEKASMITNAIFGVSNTGIGASTQEFYTNLKSQYQKYAEELQRLIAVEVGGNPFSLVGHEFEANFGVEFTMTAEEKANAIADVVQKLQDILAEAAKLDYEAQIIQLRLDAKDMSLDSDSWQEIFDRITQINSEFVENMSGVEKEFIKNLLISGFSADEALKEAEMARLQLSLEVSYGTLADSLSILTDHFGEEIDGAFEIIQLHMEKTDFWDPLFTTLSKQGGQALTDWAADMSSTFAKNKEVAKIAESILKEMEPEMSEWKDLFTIYKTNGEQIPQELHAALTQTATLGALAGDVNSILFLIGQQFSSSPEFYEMLKTTKDAFADVDQNVIDGLYSNIAGVRTTAEGVVLTTRDGIEYKLGEITPEMKANFEALGIALPESVGTGIDTGTSTTFGGDSGPVNNLYKAVDSKFAEKFVPGHFSQYGQNVRNGFKSGSTPSSSEFNATAQQYQNNVKSALGQYMNEKEFVKYGQAVPAGTKTGMGNGSDLSSHASWILRNINPKTDEVINGMKNIGGNLVKGIIEGMDKESKSQSTSNGIKNVGNKILSLTKYHTEIGSPSKLFADQVGYWLTQGIVVGMDQPDALIDPLETMYTNAKDWWDDNTMDIVGGDFEFTDESGKNHYMDIKDANNEQNTLLREQNALLRAILEKESSVGYYGTSGEAMLEAASHLNRRTGRTMIPVGG